MLLAPGGGWATWEELAGVVVAVVTVVVSLLEGTVDADEGVTSMEADDGGAREAILAFTWFSTSLLNCL